MRLNIAGRVIDVEQPDLARRLRQEWWPSGLSREPGLAERLVATVTVDGAPLPDTFGRSDLASRPDGLRVQRISDDDFQVVDGKARSAVHVRIGDPSVITIHGSTAGTLGSLDVALGEVLAVAGVVRLHAATVTDGHRTLVMSGPSGRGKSTTTLRAVRAGWRAVAEDASFVDVETLLVCGPDRAIRLRPAAASALLGAADAAATEDLRHEVPFDEIGGRPSSVRVTHLVHLRRDDEDDPAWIPMSRGDAVMALFEASGAPISASARFALASAFARIVERTRNLTLMLGPLTSPFPPLP